MINVVLDKNRGRFCLLARQSTFTVGKGQNRVTVEVEIYENTYDGRLDFCSKGIALCHPADTFDARRGAQRALENALDPHCFSRVERKKFFDVLNSWFD